MGVFYVSAFIWKIFIVITSRLVSFLGTRHSPNHVRSCFLPIFFIISISLSFYFTNVNWPISQLMSCEEIRALSHCTTTEAIATFKGLEWQRREMVLKGGSQAVSPFLSYAGRHWKSLAPQGIRTKLHWFLDNTTVVMGNRKVLFPAGLPFRYRGTVLPCYQL